MGDRRRRGPRTVVLLLALVSTLLATAGCGGRAPVPVDAGAGSAAASSTAEPAAVVMVIRHGEKPEGKHPDPGVDAQGSPDDSSLTATGWKRANALVGLFAPASGTPRPGLAVPRAIYAAGRNDDGEGQRPRETVGPLTAALGLPMNTDYGATDEKKLVQRVIAEPGPTLISWQHGGIPDIAKAFPSVTPKPPKDWPDDRYDVVWTFTRTADGWRFAQLPELVLPGDQDSVIRD